MIDGVIGLTYDNMKGPKQFRITTPKKEYRNGTELFRLKDIFTIDGPKMAAIKPPERTVEIALALNRFSQSSVAANL